MGKQIQNQSEEKPLKVHKQSKANRFEKFTESESTEKTTWKSVVICLILGSCGIYWSSASWLL